MRVASGAAGLAPVEIVAILSTTDDATTWQARHDARTEQRLRELASDLADSVERGDMTDTEANAHYERVATRWMQEI